MGHITSKNYFKLQERLDKSPQGAPASETLFKILEILFTEKEAELVSALPLNMFTAQKAAKIWKVDLEEAQKVLNELADKCILMDINDGEEQQYVLAPTMAGFFEFSLMRTDGKFDRKLLSELFYQYINVEEDFVRDVLGIYPSIARAFTHEDQMRPEDYSMILDYERASNVIETATCVAVGTCYCRHKMEHVGRACDMPQDVCLTFNNCARSLVDHGAAKEITKEKGREVLDRCVKLGLVQIGDNVQEGVSFICNCCGCCCEAILAYKKLGCNPKLVSNFKANYKPESCSGCGMCARKCPIDAITVIKDADGKAHIEIDTDKCVGCGVCARFCPSKHIEIRRNKKTAYVPYDTMERFMVSAINEGKLQNFIFQNQNLWTSALLRKFVGILLNLKPAKRMLANRQLQSRFLNVVFKTKRYSHPELDEK